MGTAMRESLDWHLRGLLPSDVLWSLDGGTLEPPLTIFRLGVISWPTNSRNSKDSTLSNAALHICKILGCQACSQSDGITFTFSQNTSPRLQRIPPNTRPVIALLCTLS